MKPQHSPESAGFRCYGQTQTAELELRAGGQIVMLPSMIQKMESGLGAPLNPYSQPQKT